MLCNPRRITKMARYFPLINNKIMINELSCAYCGELLYEDYVVEFGMVFCAYTHADEYRTTKPSYRKESTILINTNTNTNNNNSI